MCVKGERGCCVCKGREGGSVVSGGGIVEVVYMEQLPNKVDVSLSSHADRLSPSRL